MKFDIKTSRKEGFIDRYALSFENGLILMTEGTLWLTKDNKQKLLQQLKEVVEELQPGTEIPQE